MLWIRNWHRHHIQCLAACQVYSNMNFTSSGTTPQYFSDHSGQTQLYPYEENSVPEIPVRELQVTRLHSDICGTDNTRWHWRTSAGGPTVMGTAGLIFGLGGSTINTVSKEIKVMCAFEIAVPEGTTKVTCTFEIVVSEGNTKNDIHLSNCCT